MLKQIVYWLDPILLVGLFASISVSAVMVLSGNDTLSGLTIGLLSTIVTLLIDIIARIQRTEAFSRAGNQEISKNLEHSTEKIISSLQGVNIHFFDRREDAYLHVEERLKNTKSYIDIMHSSPNITSSIPSGRHYYETLADVIKSGKVRVRRIVVVNTKEHLDWVCSMFTEFSGYPLFIGCYSKVSPHIPFLSFVLIDNEEVIVTGGARTLSYDAKTIAIKNSAFADVIKDHFDEMWRGCMKLNEGDPYVELIRQLETALQRSV